VHTSFRDAYYDIAARFFDERATNGVSVLLGGGATYFSPASQGGTRKDSRDLVAAYAAEGYDVVRTRSEVTAKLAGPAPKPNTGEVRAPARAPRRCSSCPWPRWW